MIQDPEYIKKVHKALSDKVEGFNKTIDEFSAALKDEKYVNNVYKALSDKIDGFNKTPEQFKSLVYSPQKKNSNSTGSQAPKDSQSKATPKPSTSVGGKQPQVKPSAASNGASDLINKFGLKPGEKIQGVERKAYEAQRNQPKPAVAKKQDVVETKSVSKGLDKKLDAKYETISKIPSVTEKIEKGIKLTPDELITISQQQDLVINQSYNPEISKEKLNDELNEYQFLDGISEGMRKTTNKFLLQPITDINSYFGGNKDFTIKKGVPLAKEKEEAEINLINKGITDYSKEDIFEEAKNIFLKNDELSQKKNATDSYFSSLTDGHQVQRELEIKLKADYFSKDQEIKKNVQLLQVNEDRIDAYNKFLIEVDKKGFATNEDKEKGKYLFDLATKASEENKIMRKSLKDDLAKLDDDKEKLELLKYNYNDLDKTRDILNNFFKETIGGALKLVGETRELAYEQTIGRLTDAEYVDPLTSAGDYIMNIGAEYKEKQPEFRMMTFNDVNNWSDFGSYFAQVSTEQAGVASAFAVAGPLGLELVSAGSGGSKIKQLEDQEKQPFGKQYTQAQKVLTGWAYYGAEKYSEKFSTFKYLEDMKMSLKNISSASRELSQKSFKKELGKMFGATAVQSQVGGLSESSASLANSLSDIYLLGEELSSDDIAKAMKESYTAGILMDGGTASFGALSTFASKQLRAITDNKDISKVRSILDKVNEINTEIKSNLLLTESDKTNLDNKANELINEAVGIVTKSVDNIEKLSVEDISKLLDINKEQSELKSKFDELKKSAMSSDLKKEEYTDLNNRFKELESRRNDILAGTFKEFNYLPEEESTKLKIQAAEELKAEAITSGIEEDKVNIKEEDITKRAIENYEKQPKETTAEKSIEEGPTRQENVQDVTATQGQQDKVVQEEKITKTEQDAIQEQSTSEGVLRTEQSEMGLQEVVKGDQESKVTTEESKEKIKEPSIVVHGALNGFDLQYSEGIDKKDIVTPKDGRGFLPENQQRELNEYKSVTVKDDVLDNGDKTISIVTPASDNFGRSSTNTFEFTIPEGNSSTAEGIKAILDDVTKSDLKGREVIDESVKRVKEYINSNKQTSISEQKNISKPEVVTKEVKPEEKVVESIFDLDKDADLKDQTILDKAISFLDKAEKELQDIQKSGVKGVLIPAPAVQVAIKAMKGALKTAKNIGELIEIGLNALKQTEWYKNLTPDVQSNIEAELPASLSEYVFKNQQKKAQRDEAKAESSKLNKDRRSAIKNVKGGKTGFINRNSPTFRLVSLNPKIVKLSLTPEMFEKYKSQIEILSKRRLSLDLTELGGLEEFSKFVSEVENSYIDTSEKILSIQNQIDTFEEADPTAKREKFTPTDNFKDFYNENKSLFTFNNVDSETTTTEEEELNKDKEEVINNVPAITKIATDSDYSPTSNSFQILSLFSDLKQSDLDMLNRNQIIGLKNAINAIVDGFEIPTYANDIFTAIMANRSKYGLSKNVEGSYKKTGLASNRIFKAIDNLFKKFRQDEKTKAYKTNLTSIDAAFKIYGGIPKVADIIAENFKGIPVLRYIMGAIQKQQGRVTARVEEMMSNLDKVRNKLVEKSKDYEESLMKIHFAFLSAQKNSNPDNNTIQTAKDSFLANSKSSSYTESERKKYTEFLKKYGDYVITYDNGELKVLDGNGNEVKDFFIKEEIDSYNAIRKELDAQAEAAYESQFYHGKNASPLVSNYFPQNNYSTVYGNEELKSIQSAFNNPTLKSSNVKSRVVKQQAHAVGHNPFSIAISAVKSVELQHKLLTDVNIAKRALSDLIKENEGNEELKFLYENILGVVNKFVEQAQNATRVESDSIGNDVSKALETIFFRSTLASVDRTVKDLTANYTGLLLSDGEKLLASKLTNDLKDIPKEKVSEVLKNFLINSGASQPARLMNNDFDVKTSRIDFQTEGASSSLTNRGFSSKFKTFIDSVARKTKLNVPRDFFKRMNEQLQSFSDNAPALSLWAGSFYKEFEALSGTSVDMQKIASGDKAYLLKYKNEIEIASLIANYTLSSRLGSKNIAEGVQKIIDLSRNQGGNNVFEKYMNYLFSRFRIISARDTRTAINNLVQNGFRDENGAQERIIAGNALRSIVYTALAGVIPLKFASLLFGGDDDEEKIKESFDSMSSDPDFMKGIVEIYNKYEEKARKLEDSDEYMKNILQLYRDRRSELMNLLKDERFKNAVESRYKFFAREHFNKIINGHSANVDAMKKLDGNTSYINNIIKMIDDKDEPVNYIQYVDLLSYLNSEYGHMKYSSEERKEILDKAINRMEEDGFYSFREKNGGLNEKGEYDITTSEGKFKIANLFQTIDMLKNYRENSIEGRALKGGLEFAINTAAGSRGNIKVRAISTLVEVLNKYQREERYGFYDSSKDRVTNGFGRTVLNGETAFNGKFKLEEDDVTGRSLGLSKEISDVVNMTVPELAMISKMASEPKYSDIGMLLGLPTSTDLSKILREIEKDEVYQSSRGKVFYDASEKNKIFSKKDTTYKFPIKMDVESSRKIIK